MAEPMRDRDSALPTDEPTEASPLLAAAAPSGPLRRSGWRRMLRANNILGVVIPALIVVLAVKGYSLVVFQTAAYIHHVLGRPILAKVYAIQFNLFFWPILACWIAVWLISARSAPPSVLPAGVVDRTTVFECDGDGNPAVCWQDGCGGRWKPLGARHCKDCGDCRTGFDHHCAFMSACVNSSNLPSFLGFLVLALPLIGLAIIPLVPIQIAAIREVVAATWDSDWLSAVWWEHWYAWAGGPIWRYAFALALGFWRYPDIQPPRPPLFEPHPSCEVLARPQLGVLLTCVAGFFVFWIAVAMIITVVRQAASGLSSVQVARHRSWLAMGAVPPALGSGGYDPRVRLWVPAPTPVEGEEAQRGGALLVDPGLRLMDWGSPGENLRRAFRLGGTGDELPGRVVRKLQELVKETEKDDQSADESTQPSES